MPLGTAHVPSVSKRTPHNHGDGTVITVKTNHEHDKPYALSADARAAVEAWVTSDVRPALMVISPAHGVGEDDLIDELADASYGLQGFKDARRRHFISRSFPRELSDASFARFLDRAFDASEITDGFRGVDCIDLSDWTRFPRPAEDDRWQGLVEYVRDHPETDFVFLAYGDDPGPARELASSISVGSGTFVVPIALMFPSAAKLAEAFVRLDPTRLGGLRERAERRFDDALAAGTRITYLTARSCATAALQGLAFRQETGDAIEAALEQARNLDRATRRTPRIGFSGGER